MTDTNQASEDNQASRMEVHMAMLAKAENAKDAGHATVIKLGFAVSIAEEIIRTEKLKLLAEVREQKKAYVTEVRWKNATTEEAIPLDALTRLEAEL